jgi:acyl-CoA synthetase (AMP-forming)/AMP-acid ligase II
VGPGVDQNKNVGLAILKAVSADPERIAVWSESSALTYGDLGNISISMALNLTARGVRQGQIVAIRSDDIAVIIGSLVATALLGCRWIYGTKAALGSDRLTIDLLLHTAAADAGLSRAAALIDETWAMPPPGHDTAKPPRFPGYRDPDDIWMLSTTSGTTGTPKLVGLSQRIMADRLAASKEQFPAPGMGFVGLFPLSGFPLQVRLLACLVSHARIIWSFDPEFWVKSDADLVFGSPAQAAKHLEALTLPRKLPVIQLGGGQVSDAMAQNLLKSFEVLQNAYGSTESNLLLSNQKTLAADGTMINRTVVLPGVEVQTVDEDDQPVPPGSEGIVRVRNGYLAPGYYDNAEAEAAVFRGGWFYPGDLAVWTREGEFKVTGRRNDQFNLGGVKLNAQLIDFTLININGVRDAISFMMPREGEADRLTAFLSIDPAADRTEVLADAKVQLMRLGGVEAVPKRFLYADTLPRNANGKPDRRGCVALVEASRAREAERGKKDRPD